MRAYEGEMDRPTILTCCDYFLPGYKAGGPITTLGNLTANLGTEFHFKVITRDRDLGDATPYPNVTTGVWTQQFGGDVYYLPNHRWSPVTLAGVIRETDYDVLYLNSLFSPRFSAFPLLLRRLGWLPQRPVVVAPRGECAAGALSLKRRRKQIFLQAARLLALHQDVLWQAVSPHERDDICRQMGDRARVALAGNLARQETHAATTEVCPKQIGEVRLICLGRISAVKNTAEALRTLNHDFRGKISIDVVGPQEDEAYWNECQNTARRLPGQITVRFLGPVPAPEIPNLLQNYHLLFSPTRGENFGHAILEALLCGCPVLISDRTPWRNLQSAQAGWDIALDGHAAFRTVIQAVLDMDEQQFSGWRKGARQFAASHFSKDHVKEQNRQLFYRTLGSPTPRPLAA